MAVQRISVHDHRAVATARRFRVRRIGARGGTHCFLRTQRGDVGRCGYRDVQRRVTAAISTTAATATATATAAAIFAWR